MEYLENQVSVVISCYLCQMLLVYDLQTIGIGTFFVVKSSMYTIDNKAELLIYGI